MRSIPEASSIRWHRTIWRISNARQPCSSGGRVSMENTVRHQRPSLTPGPNARLSFDACAGTNVGLVRTVIRRRGGSIFSATIVDTLGPAGQRRQLSARGAAIAGNGEPAIAHRSERRQARSRHRQHGRLPALLRALVLLPLGRRQPPLPCARRPHRAYDARPLRDPVAGRSRGHLGEEARRHPRANVFTRSVGAEGR